MIGFILKRRNFSTGKRAIKVNIKNAMVMKHDIFQNYWNSKITAACLLKCENLHLPQDE